MAPIKRKNDGASESARPEKKQKPTISATKPSPTKLSLLREEEPAFPRGGASVLTPLEYKQIKIQAKQDVLFEQNTGKKSARNEFGDEEKEDDLPEQPTGPTTKTKRKPKLENRKARKTGAVEEAAVRIEGLSYKRLVAGSMILGQISQINRYDLSLNLPNNLTGFVSLTSISDKLTKRIETMAGEEEEAGEKEADTTIDLKALFHIGQYLRAYVASTQEATFSGAQGKRHIQLSINPRDANSGLAKADYIVDSMVQASVLSVEDHGLVMDLGLEDTSVRGFMSSKELGQNIDVSNIEEGSVFLCLVTGKSSNGNIIKLSADPQKIGNVKKGSFLSDAPTVDAFLPGTAVDVLVSEVAGSGLAGKVMGFLNVTADLIHSGAAASGKDLEKKYSVGSRIRGRIICTFPTVDDKKLGVSLQDHILYWRLKTATTTPAIERLPTQILPISTILNEAKVIKVEAGLGLLMDVGVKGVRGFVHISKISDGKTETISESTGPYKVGSVHKARVIGYNAVDGLFIVSMEPRVIAQPFLRMEDVKVGQVVKGNIERMIVGAEGVTGIIINIVKGITGLVSEIHFSDTRLQHPEKKFREGNVVTARVLSTDPEKRQIRLTLKKTLVNSDAEAWTSYEGLKPGLQAPGTLFNVQAFGAVVRFYGSVRGFLPVSEASESYIEDMREHFRTGQVVTVHIVSVDSVEQRMIVSCKDPVLFGPARQEALKSIEPGASVVGKVSDNTKDNIMVELEPSGLKAILPIEHLADESAQKCMSSAKRIRVGQVLKDLIVLSKSESKRLIRLTSKPSLVKAVKYGNLLKTFDDVVEGSEVQGFVNNTTPTSVFIQFAGDLTGLILKQHIPEEAIHLPNFGLRRNQSVSARVLSVDHDRRRFLLTLKPLPDARNKTNKEVAGADSYDTGLSNPVDEVSTSVHDFTLGKLTKAKIRSIKETQLNVQLADAVQGRIDISEIFDKWEEIKDRKHPLKKFHTKQVLPVRILGMHDSRNHRFLPITHRGKAPVFELTAKSSNQTLTDLDILTVAKVEVGTTWLTFVNNISEDCVWVNLSPNVRGRIRAMDISDDVSLLNDLPKNFPVGSVLRAKVLKVDVENNRLDLSARSGGSSSPMTLSDLSKGMVLPGRVTKVTERQVIVQLSESLSAPIHLVDLADDYSKADPAAYQKNQTVRIWIKDIDSPNKKITLSARPSKVLSSSLAVKDPDITSISQLKVDDVTRGFVKNVADNGLFVSLASTVTAFVRVSDLSDAFIKEWKSDFEIDQLVEGRVIAVDPLLNHIQMSLKKSQLDKNYKAPLTFSDMRFGQIIAGKVRKVEDFGVFIVVDDSANVSGLCHRTKMSDQAAVDPKKLYDEGDKVQAKVLSINKEKRQISFGLKASYFSTSTKDSTQENDDDDANDSDTSVGGIKGIEIDESSNIDEDKASDSEGDFNQVAAVNSDVEMDRIDRMDSEGVQVTSKEGTISDVPDGFQGLSTGGFDWTGGMSAADEMDTQSETDAEASQPKKKKRRRAEIKIDRTGDLDANGPQSIADFERLLLGQPNSSVLWLSYMAFQLQLSEAGKAREIAERALKTINIREETEKMNVWVALLNLENAYGSDESLEDVFKRACQYNDSQEIHERLISTYIQSGSHSKADDLFQATLKKYSQTPALYINYATFLMTTLSASDRARALLPRAMQCLPAHTHLDLTKKFAQLEFTSTNGDSERGRTVFEALFSQWPKRLDLWNVLIDLEIRQGKENKEVVRRLFERLTRSGTSLKAKKAKFFFKRWLEYEEKEGDSKSEARVKALAAEYVRAQGKQVDVQ